MRNIAEHEIFSANKYENAIVGILILLAEKISCSAELSMKKVFITSGPDFSGHSNVSLCKEQWLIRRR